jgi:hypothetical protein
VPHASEAATATTPAFFVGELVGSVVPVLLTPFALFAYLLPFGWRRTPLCRWCGAVAGVDVGVEPAQCAERGEQFVQVRLLLGAESLGERGLL